MGNYYSEKKIIDEKNILEENTSWISKVLKITKRLYANGKISQQGLLDIQIRRSELEVLLHHKEYEISKLKNRLDYLFRLEGETLDFSSIPWKIFDEKNKMQLKDYKGMALKEKILLKDHALLAAKLNYIPDVTIGIGYTKRSNIDKKGDFVSATISFPLPLSKSKYSGHKKVRYEKLAALREYENYKMDKLKREELLSKEIEKIKYELKVLNDRIIKFAKNSRAITSKSYGVGNSTYTELLQSELKLQNILLKKTMLESQRYEKEVLLKFVRGDSLYE